MPIYEYGCPDCGHHFDVIQKFSDEPVTLCPACAKVNVRKRITAPTFVLKGGGWYKDHYGLKSANAEGASASGTASSPPASSGGSSSPGGSTGSDTP